jgi:hypothetical protein
MQTTRLNRPWLWKMALFGVFCVGFGVLGLYDAIISYPRRGEAFASYAQWQYLEAADHKGPLGQSVSIPDPKAELQRLRGSSPQGLEQARFVWLNSLSKIGQLRPERTVMLNPSADYAQLKKIWTEGDPANPKPKPQPKELATLDLPFQWVIVALGFGGALYLLVLFLGARGKRYSWDESTRTLTIPGGATLTPADLEDVDKRKWDKFLVFLKIKPGHPTLAGQELKLDLLRYKPLEDWILEMERAAFPDRAAEAQPTPPAEPEPVSA